MSLYFIKNNNILAGSWREKDQIQIFDLRNAEPLVTIEWDGGVGIKRSAEPCHVYAAQLRVYEAQNLMHEAHIKLYSMRSSTLQIL